jgi:hypothetical protein
MKEMKRIIKDEEEVSHGNRVEISPVFIREMSLLYWFRTAARGAIV